jgi:hypothetical protein
MEIVMASTWPPDASMAANQYSPMARVPKSVEKRSVTEANARAVGRPRWLEIAEGIGGQRRIVDVPSS